MSPSTIPGTPLDGDLNGTVRDDAGRSRPGVEVWLSAGPRADGTVPAIARTVTDSWGQFTLNVAGLPPTRSSNEPLSVWAHEAGMAPARRGVPWATSIGRDEVELTLVPAQHRRIALLGPDGKPVAGARVRPVAFSPSPGDMAPTFLSVPGELAGRLEAPAPVVLQISSDNLVTPTGRVVDEVGNGVARVEVELWSQTAEFDEEFIVTFDGRRAVETGPEGAYRIPRSLRVDCRYRVLARAPGQQAVRSEWVRFRPGAGSAFPDLVLGRPRALAGRVLDRRGQPVAGALLRFVADEPVRPLSRTDEQGRFCLEGCATGPGFVFAEAEGFRFQGWPSNPSPAMVELHLTRSDEPAERPLATLPPALSAAQEVGLLLSLIEPTIDRALAEEVGYEAEWAIARLGYIDPLRALEVAANARLTEPERRDYLKATVAQQLLRVRPDEALAVFEAASDPWIRSDGYLRASDVLPASQRERRLEWLEQAVTHARCVGEAQCRLGCLGKIAARSLALGETARATELFHEGQTIAADMHAAADGGFARAAFAEDLAELDLPAALALIQDLGNEGDDEGEIDRHHGNVAQRLASRNPAEAERIWGMVKGPVMRDGLAQRICYRMAPIDRERAYRIAGQIGDPCWRAHGLGMMGLALSASDQRTAARLLDEATMALVALGGSWDESGAYAEPAVTAATLLPVAEAIEPGQVAELLWRALALRRPRCDGEFWEVRRLGADAAAAMMVARYDRTIAQAVLEPILERLPHLIAGGVSYFPETLFVAPAVVDPRRAVALLESLPEESSPRNSSAWSQQRMRVAEMLTLQGAERWRRAIQHAGFWDVDGDD
jgi:hypothetical protein